MWLAITLLALAGALVWLLRRPVRPRDPAAADERDAAALREAEDEVRHLDAMTPPEDADQHLTDWGPGAPR
jgi:hypothetical protein